MVVDADVLAGEINRIRDLGIEVTPERLFLSQQAHLSFPFHQQIDRALEALRDAPIGTTHRGIGPAFADKHYRRGLRLGDLARFSDCASWLKEQGQFVNGLLATGRSNSSAHDSLHFDLQDNLEYLQRAQELIPPYLCDIGDHIAELALDGKVLFEGAQGAMLDIDHGCYPFVTSSTTLPVSASVASGLGPTCIGEVLGVAKCYLTRVGAGPFPTEMSADDNSAMRHLGGEFGATTGRPRRCGWLDLPALRRAIRMAGIDQIALTKVDILAQFPRVHVCTAYQVNGKLTSIMPTFFDPSLNVEPIYSEVPRFAMKAEAFGDKGAWSDEFKEFLDLLDTQLDVPVTYVSFGPKKNDIIRR